MLGKLSIAVAAILMMPTALSAQVGGAAIQGAVSPGIPTPADLSASSSAYYRSIQKHNAAHKKKLKRSDARKRYMQRTQTPSLDGRVTGRSRTCGFATFQYDGWGVPYGPYCH
jgi:hypothetical protein